MTKRSFARVATLGAAAAISGLGLVAASTPALAVNYKFYKGDASGTCLYVPQSGTTVVRAHPCTGNNNEYWSVTSVDIPGKRVRVFKNRQHGTCLDANGTNVYVAAKACNGSNDQRWELFTNADSSLTFKSWGAWINRSEHKCMQNAAGSDALVQKPTCNANLNSQQWK